MGAQTEKPVKEMDLSVSVEPLRKEREDPSLNTSRCGAFCPRDTECHGSCKLNYGHGGSHCCSVCGNTW